jgi:hypothetical protein
MLRDQITNHKSQITISKFQILCFNGDDKPLGTWEHQAACVYNRGPLELRIACVKNRNPLELGTSTRHSTRR